MKRYNVEGMSCGGCARAVREAIRAKSAQAEVLVDLEAKRVTVRGFENEEAIKEAIEGAGFDLL